MIEAFFLHGVSVKGVGGRCLDTRPCVLIVVPASDLTRRCD